MDKDAGPGKSSDLPKVIELRVTDLGQDVRLPPSLGVLSAVAGSVVQKDWAGGLGAGQLRSECWACHLASPLGKMEDEVVGWLQRDRALR